MKIKDYALNCEDGWMDTDVTDTIVDLLVAFVWDANREIEDEYDRFLSLLANNIEVTRFPSERYNMKCDFSGFFKNLNTELTMLYKELNWEKDEEFEYDEICYDFVNSLDGLIAGYSSESTYRAINKILSKDQ